MKWEKSQRRESPIFLFERFWCELNLWEEQRVWEKRVRLEKLKSKITFHIKLNFHHLPFRSIFWLEVLSLCSLRPANGLCGRLLTEDNITLNETFLCLLEPPSVNTQNYYIGIDFQCLTLRLHQTISTLSTHRCKQAYSTFLPSLCFLEANLAQTYFLIARM